MQQYFWEDRSISGVTRFVAGQLMDNQKIEDKTNIKIFFLRKIYTKINERSTNKKIF
jgi:hypothetical protein